MKLLICITGASGVIYGVRFLEVLKELGVERHLVMSTAAQQTVVLETDYRVSEVEALASKVHRFDDMAAAPASGSFRTDGMVVIPCSMKTLSGIACGYGDDLIARSAETTLKERRPLLLVPRETPLSIIDMENMLRIARAGAIIVPAMPGFYNRPKTLDGIVDYMVGKVLDLVNVEHSLFERWTGPKAKRETT